MSSVSNLLKSYGEHTRRMLFPDHVMPSKILEMANNCTKVTHLSLPRGNQLSLDDLEIILLTMTQLQQLDMFLPIKFYMDQLSKDCGKL